MNFTLLKALCMAFTFVLHSPQALNEEQTINFYIIRYSAVHLSPMVLDFLQTVVALGSKLF